MLVFGSGALGRWLGCESGALMNGNSTLIKETPENWVAAEKRPAENAIWGPTLKRLAHHPVSINEIFQPTGPAHTSKQTHESDF